MTEFRKFSVSWEKKAFIGKISHHVVLQSVVFLQILVLFSMSCDYNGGSIILSQSHATNTHKLNKTPEGENLILTYFILFFCYCEQIISWSWYHSN